MVVGVDIAVTAVTCWCGGGCCCDSCVDVVTGVAEHVVICGVTWRPAVRAEVTFCNTGIACCNQQVCVKTGTMGE